MQANEAFLELQSINPLHMQAVVAVAVHDAWAGVVVQAQVDRALEEEGELVEGIEG